MDIQMRKLHSRDFATLVSIYNYYILNTTVTFRKDALSEKDIPSILPINHAKYKSYLILEKDQPVGFCALSRFRDKEAYDRTAEVVVYLHPNRTGKGIGSRALKFLEQEAQKIGVRVLIGIISAENTQSVKAFEKAGYHKCAHLKNVGIKFDRILDVVMLQKEMQ